MSDFEKKCKNDSCCKEECCDKKCCNDCCDTKKCCCKKSKSYTIAAMVCVSFLVSLGVVKFFAPCIVKQAMIKEFVEKQMDFEMFQSKMIKKMIIKKLEMEIAKKHTSKTTKQQKDVK